MSFKGWTDKMSRPISHVMVCSFTQWRETAVRTHCNIPNPIDNIHQNYFFLLNIFINHTVFSGDISSWPGTIMTAKGLACQIIFIQTRLFG